MVVYKEKNLKELTPHGAPEFPLFVHENIFIYNNGAFPPHWHDEFEILYLEKGRARFDVDGEYFVLVDNEFLFVNCGSIHSGKELVKSIGYAIVFDLRFLSSEGPDIIKCRYFTPLKEGRFFVPNLIKDNELREDICKIIEVFKIKPFGYELQIKALLFNIFTRLFRYYVKPRTNWVINSKLDKIKGVLEYVNLNYHRHFTLEELAEIGGISKFYLCRIFKEVLYMSPLEYINKVKVEKAGEFLRNTEMSITEVALECGFENISYFIRIFKKYMQVTPLKYKKIGKNQLIL